MMIPSKLILAVVCCAVLTSCATSDFSGKTPAQRVESQIREASDTILAPRPVGVVTEVDGPFMDFKATRARLIEGSVTLDAAGAPFGPTLAELGRQAGYSVVFAEGVDTNRKVTLRLNKAFPEEALRQVGALAGYAVAIDKDRKTATVASEAVYTFRVPARVFQQLSASYVAGGNPSATGNQGGQGAGMGGAPAASPLGGGSPGTQGQTSGASVSASFMIRGNEGGTAQTVQKLLSDLAGKNSEVMISDMGIISVKGNAQSLRRVHDFLRTFVRDAMTTVEIEASIVEVVLNDKFELGIDWQRVLGSSRRGTISLSGASSVTNPALSATYSTSSINAVVNALRELADARVISRPRIVATHNTPATFFDGMSLPYLGNAQSTVSGTAGTAQTTAQLSFAVDGVSFSVIPSVLDDKTLQLTLMPVLSSVTGFDEFNLGGNVLGGGIRLTGPRQATKNTFMQTIAESGKTVILGGIRFNSRSVGQNVGLFTLLGGSYATSSADREVAILMRALIVPPPEFEPLVSESI